jgi:threonine/homoserine/homoserine lactone efflux protein
MHVLPFLAISAIVVVTPGVDMALVTKNALLYGRSAARATALGVNLGIFLWTLAAALGLAAVIAASAVRVHGDQARRRPVPRLPGRARLPRLARADGRTPSGSAFRQGLASNLLNPKIAVFFTSLLPQFVDAEHARPQDLLLLGVLFNCMGVIWLLTYADLAARGRDVLARPRVKRALDRLSGVALVALGVRLALERK